MDYSRIPYFATFRQTGTVIIRVKMEVSDVCRPEACPRSHNQMSTSRPTSCEKCFRTRSQRFSNSDSDIVRGRQYSASSARSRYVNVCAAVCLILLLGDILPLTTAAPGKRTMSRERRSTKENSLWGNPCDYGSNYKSTIYSAKLASRVANQARSAYKSTSSYKDEFAKKLHTYSSFEKLLPVWSGMEWLRNFSWYTDPVLPKDKVINGEMPEEYLDREVMENLEDVLPRMYKSLKMIVAGLDSISKEGLNEDIITDGILKQNISQSVQDVRAVLCVFFDLMKSRNLEIMPLLDEDVPPVNNKDDSSKLSYSTLVYRDTLNYLDYIGQVFHRMNEKDSKLA